MDRVIVYIDASNLYKGAEENCGNGKIKLSQFVKFLAKGRPLIGVKYFCVDPPDPNKNHFNMKNKKGRNKYLKAVESSVRSAAYLKQLDQWKKIELIKGRLQRTKDGVLKEKGVDVALAIHLVVDAASNNHDTSIVVSGDADFVFPVNVALNWGKNVEGAAFQPCYNMADACPRGNFTFLTANNMQPFIVDKGNKQLKLFKH